MRTKLQSMQNHSMTNHMLYIAKTEVWEVEWNNKFDSNTWYCFRYYYALERCDAIFIFNNKTPGDTYYTYPVDSAKHSLKIVAGPFSFEKFIPFLNKYFNKYNSI